MFSEMSSNRIAGMRNFNYTMTYNGCASAESADDISVAMTQQTDYLK